MIGVYYFSRFMVSVAIISSSSVGMTTTFTRESSAEMTASSPRVLFFSSSSGQIQVTMKLYTEIFYVSSLLREQVSKEIYQDIRFDTMPIYTISPKTAWFLGFLVFRHTERTASN